MTLRPQPLYIEIYPNSSITQQAQISSHVENTSLLLHLSWTQVNLGSEFEPG